MNRSSTLRLATIAAVAAALMLAGCGRKGQLDPPPSASAVPQETAPPSGERPQGSLLKPRADDTRPTAAPGQKRPMPMDVLLN